MISLGAVILAAGASSRMGRPKMVLPWGERTVLGHILHQSSKLAQELSVVIPPGVNAVAAELDRIDFPPGSRIVNPAPAQGMFSSVQCAARWTGWSSQATHFALILGDQPQISARALHQLREFASANENSICQPSRLGRPKHPLILPGAVFRRIASSSGPTLREFFSSCPAPRAFLELDDPTLDFDLDTPDDYARLQKEFL